MAICENCGAEVEEKEPRCPYCGTFQYPGAEKEYWEKLGQMKENMKELEPLQKKLYRNEVHRQVRKAGKRLKICAVLLALLAAGGIFWMSWEEKREAETEKAQILWQQEVFPKLDNWYETGDYDAILAFEQELYEEDSPYRIWNWKHSAFLECYEAYLLCTESRERLRMADDAAPEWEKENCLEDILYWSVWLGLKREQDFSDAKEWEQILKFREETREMCFESFIMNEKEMEEAQKQIGGEGYADFDACEDYVREWMKQRDER